MAQKSFQASGLVIFSVVIIAILMFSAFLLANFVWVIVAIAFFIMLSSVAKSKRRS